MAAYFDSALVARQKAHDKDGDIWSTETSAHRCRQGCKPPLVPPLTRLEEALDAAKADARHDWFRSAEARFNAQIDAAGCCSVRPVTIIHARMTRSLTTCRCPQQAP